MKKILILGNDENGKAITHEYRAKKPNTMANRKYTRAGEEPKAYECTKRKCKWQGTDEQRRISEIDAEYGVSELVCPKCGNNEFYGLLNVPQE